MNGEKVMGEAQTKLVNALIIAGAAALMIEHAKQGLFDDYKSPHAMPCVMLVEACRAAGLKDLANRAMVGEFYGTKADSDAWAASPDGQAVLAELRSPE